MKKLMKLMLCRYCLSGLLIVGCTNSAIVAEQIKPLFAKKTSKTSTYYTTNVPVSKVTK